MISFSRLFSTFKEFYQEINPATLTGAIDVVVIVLPDDVYRCSPFHVRFGKMGVLRSREKVVDLHVNDEPVSIHMKLSDNGEAFFVEPVADAEADVPPDLSTSPIEFRDSDLETRQLKRHEGFERDRSCPVDRPWIVEAGKAVSSTMTLPLLDSERTKSDISNLDVRAVSSVDDLQVNSTKNSFTSPHQLFWRRSCSLKDRGNGIVGSVPEIWDSVAPRRRRPRKSKQSKFVHSRSWHGACADSSFLSFSSEGPSIAASRPNIRLTTAGNSQAKTKDAQRSVAETRISRVLPAPVVKRDHDHRPDDEDHIFVIEVNDDESSANKTNEPPVSPQLFPKMTSLTIDGEEQSASKDAATGHQPPDQTPCVRLQAMTSQGSDEFDSSNQEKLEMVRKESEALGKVLNEASDWKYEKHLAKQQTAHSTAAKATADSDSQSSGWSIWPFVRSASRPNVPTSRNDEIYLKDLEFIDPVVAASYLNKKLTPPEKRIVRTGSDRETEGSVVVDPAEYGPDDVMVTTLSPPSHGKETMQSFSGQESSVRPYPGGEQAPSSGVSTNDDVGYDSKPCSEVGSDDGHRPFYVFPDSVTDIAVSTCGSLDQQDAPNYAMRFEEKIVKFEQLNLTPDLLFNPDVVFRISGKFYNLHVVVPMLVSRIVFHQTLNPSTIAYLLNEHQPKPSHEVSRGRGVSSWFSWRRSKDGSQSEHAAAHSQQSIDDAVEEHLKSREPTAPTDFQEESSYKYDWHQRDALSDSEVDTARKPSQSRSRFKRSFLLSSDQLKSLNLKAGRNSIRFSVTTKYQGTCWCECHIFLWQWDDKIVISDIDGTITKSDVLGQILPIVGGQWAQVGVAELFTRIVDNGYRILYLSARAIGQSQWTKDYLRSVRQDQRCLPDGPLLLSPTSMMMALHREIIEKKPEVFKTSCLSDIRVLFPESLNPFYAGFGNRPNDVIAYTAAGVPSHRIFTINPNGLVELVSKRLTMSYCHIADLVDLIFPPLNRAGVDHVLHSGFFEPEKFSTYTFWRISPVDPLLEVCAEPASEDQAKTNKRNSTSI